jgi:hypothetical protein
MRELLEIMKIDNTGCKVIAFRIPPPPERKLGAG